MKTKIGTEVAHVTRDSDTTFKVKRSRSPGRFANHRVGASGGCSGGRCNVLAVGNCCYVAVCSAAQGAQGEERGGGYRGGRPPTACYNLHCGFGNYEYTVTNNWFIRSCLQTQITSLTKKKLKNLILTCSSATW